MKVDLKGKVAIVTGAGAEEGIGRKIVEVLYSAGANVALADIRGEEVREASDALSSQRRKAVPIALDVSNSEEVKDMIQKVESQFGHLDILVNNAGVVGLQSIEEITEEDWDRLMAVNLKGPFLCSKFSLPLLKRSKSGRIINIASLAGQVGSILVGAHYAASKAGLINLTKSLAKYAGRYGITVNAVAPGPVKTGLWERPETRIDTNQKQEYTSQTPFKRMATPEDVANAVLYLASPEASYITGATIDVNGGMNMR